MLALGQNEPSAQGVSCVDPAGHKLPKLQTDGADEIDWQKYPLGHMSQRNPSVECHPGSQGKHGGGIFGTKARFMPA
jgi:hypothetical protein